MKNKILVTILAVTLTACGLVTKDAAKSALDIIAPIAAEKLTDLIRKRYGVEVDQESAGCYELPEFATDEDGFEYVICRAKPAE